MPTVKIEVVVSVLPNGTKVVARVRKAFFNGRGRIISKMALKASGEWVEFLPRGTWPEGTELEASILELDLS